MNQESRTELPYKTLKRILVNNLGGQVSTESVEYIQSLLQQQLKTICKNVVIQQEKDNKLRKFHGLPPKRRYDVTLFKSLSVEGLYPPPELDGLSKEAESVNPTSSPKYKADEEVM
jgi:hypothetical protein